MARQQYKIGANLEERYEKKSCSFIMKKQGGKRQNGGDITLIQACKDSLSDTALKLVETGKSMPELIDDYGNTALMIACFNKLSEVAIKLIETGESMPETVNADGCTALILACDAELSDVALKLIETGKSMPELIDNDGDTALTMACNRKLQQVALNLIKTGKSMPGAVNKDGETALILACLNKLPEVALKLIETGKSMPETINIKGGNTALIVACYFELPEVALKLIETGKSIPETINKNGDTALIMACYNKLPEVALKLIETGKSMPETINKDGETALRFAIQKNMILVVDKIKNNRLHRDISQINIYLNTPTKFPYNLDMELTTHVNKSDFLSAFSNILNSRFCTGLSLFLIKNYIRKSDALITVEFSDELLGFASLTIDKDALYIGIICTNPNIKNIGTQLLGIITSIAVHLRLVNITLDSVDSAVQFYIKNGFIPGIKMLGTTPMHKYIENNTPENIPETVGGNPAHRRPYTRRRRPYTRRPYTRRRRPYI